MSFCCFREGFQQKYQNQRSVFRYPTARTLTIMNHGVSQIGIYCWMALNSHSWLVDFFSCLSGQRKKISFLTIINCRTTHTYFFFLYVYMIWYVLDKIILKICLLAWNLINVYTQSSRLFDTL